MEFSSANPSVVRSVRQRDLLNAWLRALGADRTLPRLADYRPDRVADELADMMGYDVEVSGGTARFIITQEGSRLTATYGNEHIAPEARTNRYLDDAIGPARYARVVACYLACLEHRRPSYSISTVRDADGKDVLYERLLLPFGAADRVEQIIGSYKTISIEGGFKVNNLMGIRSSATPVSIVNAVIDREPVRSPAALDVADDLIELN